MALSVVVPVTVTTPAAVWVRLPPKVVSVRLPLTFMPEVVLKALPAAAAEVTVPMLSAVASV